MRTGPGLGNGLEKLLPGSAEERPTIRLGSGSSHVILLTLYYG